MLLTFAFLFRDDVISDRVAMQWNKELNGFFVQGRHLACTVMITTQHTKGVGKCFPSKKKKNANFAAGPLIRGNLDLVVIQPNFQLQARRDLHEMYGKYQVLFFIRASKRNSSPIFFVGGYMHHDYFFNLMDSVVLDENMPGSTPQEPKKDVRTLIVRDFENTTNPSIKYAWYKAADPGKFRMLHPRYWKEQDNQLMAEKDASKLYSMDPVKELDKIRAVASIPY